MDHRLSTTTTDRDRALNQNTEFDEPLLAQERVEELRSWIDTGGHERPEVIDEVARRMLARGDV